MTEHLLVLSFMQCSETLNCVSQQEEQQHEEQQLEELMFEEDSVLGEEEREEEEEEEGKTNRVLVELELLVCKTRHMVGNMTTTGGKVLLTALLGLTGELKMGNRKPVKS